MLTSVMGQTLRRHHEGRVRGFSYGRSCPRGAGAVAINEFSVSGFDVMVKGVNELITAGAPLS
jgi:hypothetical protein